MHPEPVPADPGWDDDPSRYAAEPEGPWWQDEEEAAPEDELTPQELAEIREAARRPAFHSGTALDGMPGGPELALFADAAAGADDGYADASDDELTGVLRAWDRVEAHAAARKLAAVAELIRRNPGPGCAPEGAVRLPAGWDEFTADELAHALAESRGRADDMLTLALRLAARLPGTVAALRDGVITRGKAEIIAWATALLDPDEALAAEALVLGRAGRLTPGGLRAAIARAVMQVAPEKARKRREQAARDARVQRWAEDSGNAALMGRELPPAEVLAADQRITAWARELKAAGLEGDMTCCAPGPTWTCCSARTPGPARTPTGRTPAARTRRRARRHRAGRRVRPRRAGRLPGRGPGGRGACGGSASRVRRAGDRDRPADYPAGAG